MRKADSVPVIMVSFTFVPSLGGSNPPGSHRGSKPSVPQSRLLTVATGISMFRVLAHAAAENLTPPEDSASVSADAADQLRDTQRRLLYRRRNRIDWHIPTPVAFASESLTRIATSLS